MSPSASLFFRMMKSALLVAAVAAIAHISVQADENQGPSRIANRVVGGGITRILGGIDPSQAHLARKAPASPGKEDASDQSPAAIRAPDDRSSALKRRVSSILGSEKLTKSAWEATHNNDTRSLFTEHEAPLSPHGSLPYKWPLLQHLVSLLRSGRIDDSLVRLPWHDDEDRRREAAKRAEGDDPALNAALGGSAAPASNSDGTVPPPAPGSFDVTGVRAPLPLSALLSAYNGDANAKRAAEAVAREVQLPDAAVPVSALTSGAAPTFGAAGVASTGMGVTPQSLATAAAAASGCLGSPPAPSPAPPAAAVPAPVVGIGAVRPAGVIGAAAAAAASAAASSKPDPAEVAARTRAGVLRLLSRYYDGPGAAADADSDGDGSDSAGAAPSRAAAPTPAIPSLGGGLRGGSVALRGGISADASPSPSAAGSPSAPPRPSQLPRRRPFLVHGAVPPAVGSAATAASLTPGAFSLGIGAAPLLLLSAAGAGGVGGWSHLALRLASALPNNTVVTLAWRSREAGSGVGKGSDDVLPPIEVAAGLKSAVGAPNAWFASLPQAYVPHADSAALVAHMQARLGVSDEDAAASAATSAPAFGRFSLGATVLLDLPAYASESLLPHEYEATVGRLLTLSRYAVVPAALPDSRYFSYWAGSEALVAAAARAVGLVASIRVVTTDAPAAAPLAAVGGVRGVATTPTSSPGPAGYGGNSAGGGYSPATGYPASSLLLVALQRPEEVEAEAWLYAQAAALVASGGDKPPAAPSPAAAAGGSAAQPCVTAPLSAAAFAAQLVGGKRALPQQQHSRLLGHALSLASPHSGLPLATASRFGVPLELLLSFGAEGLPLRERLLVANALQGLYLPAPPAEAKSSPATAPTVAGATSNLASPALPAGAAGKVLPAAPLAGAGYGRASRGLAPPAADAVRAAGLVSGSSEGHDDEVEVADAGLVQPESEEAAVAESDVEEEEAPGPLPPAPSPSRRPVKAKAAAVPTSAARRVGDILRGGNPPPAGGGGGGAAAAGGGGMRGKQGGARGRLLLEDGTASKTASASGGALSLVTPARVYLTGGRMRLALAPATAGDRALTAAAVAHVMQLALTSLGGGTVGGGPQAATAASGTTTPAASVGPLTPSAGASKAAAAAPVGVAAAAGAKAGTAATGVGVGAAAPAAAVPAAAPAAAGAAKAGTAVVGVPAAAAAAGGAAAGAVGASAALPALAAEPVEGGTNQAKVAPAAAVAALPDAAALKAPAAGPLGPADAAALEASEAAKGVAPAAGALPAAAAPAAAGVNKMGRLLLENPREGARPKGGWGPAARAAQIMEAERMAANAARSAAVAAAAKKRASVPGLATRAQHDSAQAASDASLSLPWDRLRPLPRISRGRSWAGFTSFVAGASSAAGAVGGGRRVSNWASGAGAGQAALVAAERPSFSTWWAVAMSELRLREVIPAAAAGSSGKGGPSFTSLVTGPGTSLLAVKLARTFPSASVLSLLSGQRDPATADGDEGGLVPAGSPALSPAGSHAELLKLLSVHNNFVATSSLTPARVKALLGPYRLPGRPASALESGSNASDCADGLQQQPELFPFTLALHGGSTPASAASGVASTLSLLPAAAVAVLTSPSASTVSSTSGLAELIARDWEDRLAGVLALARTSVLQLPTWQSVTGAVLGAAPVCDGTTLGCRVLGPSAGGLRWWQGEDVSRGSAAASRGAEGMSATVTQEGDAESDEDSYPSLTTTADGSTDGSGDDFAALFDGAPADSASDSPPDVTAALDGLLSLLESDQHQRTADSDGSNGGNAANAALQLPAPGGSAFASPYAAGASPVALGAVEALTSRFALGKLPAGAGSAGGIRLVVSGVPVTFTVAPSASGLPKQSKALAALPAWFIRAYGPWVRLLAQAAARTTAAAPGTTPLSAPRVRVIIGDRSHVFIRVDHAPPGSDSADGEGDAAATMPPAALPLPGTGGGCVLPSASRGFSVHALLTLGVTAPLRARLARMFLSLPLPAIARAAHAAGYAVGLDSGSASRPDFSLAPWSIALVRDGHESCSARLAVPIVPTSASGSGASLVFRSGVCLNVAADDDDTVGDGGSSLADSLADQEEDGGEDEDGASGSSTATASSSSPATRFVHLRETWAALASQLTPTDTASGMAQVNVTGPSSESSDGAAPESAYLHVPGRFSFVEHGSGLGSLSLLVARAFPAATVLSIEPDAAATDAHLAASLRGGVLNNVIARSPVDESTAKKLFESPEFFRYQMLSTDLPSLLLAFTAPPASGIGSAASAAKSGLDRLSTFLGTLAALAGTTFMHVPPSALLSLAFSTFADSEAYPRPAGWLQPSSHEAVGWGLGSGASLGHEALGKAARARTAGGAGSAGGGSRYSTESIMRHMHLHDGHAHAGDGGSSGAGASVGRACCLSLFALPGRASPVKPRGRVCSGWGDGADFAPLGGAEPIAEFALAAPASAGSASGGGATVPTLLAAMGRRFALAAHPRPPLQSAELRLLSSLVRAPAGAGGSIRVVAAPVPAVAELPLAVDDIAPARAPLSRLSLAAMHARSVGAPAADAPPASDWLTPVLPFSSLSSGLVRLDVASLVRHVNHHFESGLDGHTRKYTLRVVANVSAAVELAAATAEAGVSALYEMPVIDAYARLPPGSHPNHGHTVTCEDAEAASLAAAASGAPLVDGAFSPTGGALVLCAGSAASAAYADALASAAAPKILRGMGQLDAGLDPAVPRESKADAKAKKQQQPKRGKVAPSASPLPSAAAGPEPSSPLPGVTTIILTRDMDGALIPYETVQGITLITALRLGLLAPLRTRAYHHFVALPLYADMAPWNIVFMGGQLDYIDYDTRDVTFDAVVPRAYEVMEVLFNYKRTLEDFKRCGGKGSNPYNFPFVSECVGGSDFSGPCKDSAFPVPCGDGTCKPDYVSCLRSLSLGERSSDGERALGWAFREYSRARQAGGEADPAASDGLRSLPASDGGPGASGSRPGIDGPLVEDDEYGFEGESEAVAAVPADSDEERSLVRRARAKLSDQERATGGTGMLSSAQLEGSSATSGAGGSGVSLPGVPALLEYAQDGSVGAKGGAGATTGGKNKAAAPEPESPAAALLKAVAAAAKRDQRAAATG